eukprot:CAMPEP_0172722168 /NCGR_PEP_ID=MMETSP1074-20121228/80820_1 /TAXON_ID=2916 /ORGANISM="Ceratium fusus, Strain PA161109" /LENGTH=705 /DNA_ID=CAMNT_0013548101 /DNA_START=43 /DNA_END=2160 /DNA_ORIENTATION=-
MDSPRAAEEMSKFLRNASDGEEDDSTRLVREPAGGNARQVGRACPQILLRAVLLGALAGLVLVGITVRLSMGPVGANSQTMNLAAAPKASKQKAEGPKREQGSPFTQCGGKNFKKSTCCARGCACIKDTMYYSMCKPPTGSQDCSEDLMKDEVDKAQSRADDGKVAFQGAKDVANTKKQPAKDAANKLKQARKNVKKAAANLKAKQQAEKDGIAKAKKENESVLKAAKAEKTKAIQAAKTERATVEKNAAATLKKTLKDAEDKYNQVSKNALELKTKVIKDATSEREGTLKKTKEEHEEAVATATKLHTSEEKNAKETMHKTLAQAKKDLDDMKKAAAAEYAKTEKRLKKQKADAEAHVKNSTEANKAAYDAWLKKSKELGFVQGWIDEYNKLEAERKTKKCVALWESCAGKCCPLGCKCNMQNAYYGTCNGMFGKKFCDWKTAVAKQNKSVEAMPILTRDLHEFDKAKNKSEEVLAKAKESLKKIVSSFKENLADASKKQNSTVSKAQKKHDDQVVAAKKKMETAIAASKKKKKDTIAEAQAKADKATKECKAKADKTIADAKSKFEKDTKAIREETKKTKKEAHSKFDQTMSSCKAKEKASISAAKKKEVDTIKPAMQKVLDMTTSVRADRKKAEDQKRKAIADRSKKHQESEAALKALLHAEKTVKEKKKNVAKLNGEVETWKKASSSSQHCGVDAGADLEV